MGMVMGFTAVILAVAASLVGVMVWTALIFPRPAERAYAALETRPWRCFLTGIILVVCLGVPAVALMNAAHGQVKLAGWVVAFPLVSILVVGLTAMAQLLGDRLRRLSPAVTPLGALVRGAITLELALIVPFFGWFLFAPLVAFTLVGAGALGCRQRRKAAPPGYGDTEPLFRDSHDAREASGTADPKGADEPIPLIPASSAASPYVQASLVSSE